jgi:DNA-binding FadR family transcriptional regulator
LTYLVAARRIIAPEVPARAAARATPAQVERIQEFARRMDRNFRAGRDWMEADIGFHNALYEAAGNPVIQGMLQWANDLLIDSRRETMRDHAVSERACHFHLLIASAVADHKPMLARALMQEHMDDAVEVFTRLHGTQVRDAAEPSGPREEKTTGAWESRPLQRGATRR